MVVPLLHIFTIYVLFSVDVIDAHRTALIITEVTLTCAIVLVDVVLAILVTLGETFVVAALIVVKVDVELVAVVDVDVLCHSLDLTVMSRA